MEHAATLDLDQFEDSEFYDKLERAQATNNRAYYFTLTNSYTGAGHYHNGISCMLV